MEKIIAIDGRDVRFKSTAALPLHYATHFGSDVLMDALSLTDENKAASTIHMFRMIWTMAYCADKTIKPLEQWIEEFESFPIYKVFPELDDMFWASVKGVTKKN